MMHTSTYLFNLVFYGVIPDLLFFHIRLFNRPLSKLLMVGFEPGPSGV